MRAGRWLSSAAVLAGLLAAFGLTLASSPAASAAPAATRAAVASGPSGDYLALGDSVAFGYRPSQVTPRAEYADAANFKSYANDLAADEGLTLTNASCPGETTSSFISTSAQSNGCENVVGTPSPTNVYYRQFAPLHVDYQGSQLAFAESFLESHPDTKLVTMTLGANDAFVCEETTADACAAPGEVEATFQTISQNLTTIYTGLRSTGYEGPIVALGYYSTSPYTDASAVAGSEALNEAIATPTLAAGGIMADGLGAFKTASASFNGDPCAAGLLIALPGGTCNVHPTAKGHQILASAFTAALAGAGDHVGQAGYVLTGSDGSTFPYGDAPTAGSLGDTVLTSPVVASVETPDAGGYWLVTASGQVSAFGDATNYGSVSGTLNKPIVGMAATPGGTGYWLVASDGGVFSFGDAGFHGSTGNITLNKPIVGMAATPGGTGYWLVASDGGVFSFGDAGFHGSTGNITLNKPIVGMAATPGGTGYWLVASDGGVFSFGDANYAGSAGGSTLIHPVVAISVPG
jgi:lysophospholipase L1-like esterase